MALILTIGGLAALGVICYTMYDMSMKSIYMNRQTDMGDVGTIAEYQPVSNCFADPRNTVSNPELKLVRREEGPFGVPRNIYKGNDGGSNIVTYGTGYNKF